MTENPMLAIGDRLRKAGRGSSDHIVLYPGVELFFIYYSDKFYHFRQHFLIEKDIQVHIRPAHRRVYERVPDSQRLGYENQGNFTQAFKDLVHMKPSEYRRQSQKAHL